jgi:hypothetical protein
MLFWSGLLRWTHGIRRKVGLVKSFECMEGVVGSLRRVARFAKINGGRATGTCEAMSNDSLCCPATQWPVAKDNGMSYTGGCCAVLVRGKYFDAVVDVIVRLCPRRGVLLEVCGW